MRTALSDLRLAIRGLRRSPLFAIVATLSLALGIGANTAIFTLMDQILLRKLPVKDPDRLVMLYQQGAHNGSNMGTRMHSYPVYQDLQQRAEPLGEVICRRLAPASVSIDNETERVNAELVSGNYFSMLGVKPAIGRVFSSEEDDRVYGGHPVVVLGYDYWVRRFPRSVQEREEARHHGGDRILAAAQRFLDRPHRVDVHGRSRVADRVRERREPADRTRVHAAERARGPLVAGRITWTSGPSD